ncbi:hypothetical protein CO111_04270, partial [Candidatus Desantisbacteria bacterium CG_4_9_14_3_um_filter_50_7]
MSYIATADYLILKYTSSGDTIWQKTYDSGNEDYGFGIAVDSSGSVCVNGYSTPDFAAYDILTVKFDPNGDMLWARTFDGGPSDFGYKTAVDPAGCFYVSGYSFNGTDNDAVAIKYDSSGNSLWVKIYSTGGGDYGYGIDADPEGNAYLTGQVNDADFFLIKLNTSGDSVWQAVYDAGSTDKGFDAVVEGSPAGAGNVYMFGYASNGLSYDFFTIKYDQHPVAALKITSLPFSITQNSTSTAITVQAVDDTGALDASFSGTAALVTSSPGGRFSATFAPWSDTTEITLSSGAAGFYYVDSETGNPVITAYRESLIAGSQAETIISPTGSLVILSGQFSIRQKDISPAIEIEARDYTGAKDTSFNGTVCLFTSSQEGRFSASGINWADTTVITLSSGYGVFYYTDRETGNPAISVYREGMAEGSQVEPITVRNVFIKIVSPPFTASLNNPSPGITVQAQDETGARDLTFDSTCALLTSSPAGRFSADKNAWADTTEVTFMSGAAVLYYKDGQAGNPVITVTRYTLHADTQTETVVLPSVNAFASYLRMSKVKIQADGVDAVTVLANIFDTFGNPVPGETVTLITSRGNSDSVGPSNPQVTDANGQSTFTVSSQYMGACTITAACAGLTVTENMLNNPSFEQSFSGETTASWWDFTGDNPGQHTGSWSWTENVADGARAMVHSCLSNNDNYLQAQWVKPYRPTYPVYTATPDVSYLVSQFARTELSSGVAGIRVVWFKNVEDTAAIGELTGGSISGSNPWTLISGSVTAPADANGILFRNQNWGAGTAWFDCVRLQRTPTVEFISGSKFGIATPARSLTAGGASESICIQAQFASGVKDISYTGTCAVAMSSALGFLSASASGPWSDSVTLNFIDGETAVYFTDSRSGSPVITVTGALASCTQAQTVSPGPFSETASFIFVRRSVSADGASPCTVTVFVSDYGRNPVAGAQVVITTARKGTGFDAFDTIAQPGLTDASGFCTGAVYSTLAGKDTITAYLDGDPSKRIQNTIFSDISVWLSQFDEGFGSTAFSISRYGGFATLQNGTLWAEGKHGSCLSFDGVNDFASAADADIYAPA